MTLPDPPIGPLAFPFGYDDFDSLVGRLKRSAIDAYTCGGTPFRIVGDHYENQTSTGHWLSRPDEHGRGGGEPLTEGEDWGDPGEVAEEFQREFDRIRRDIDTMVDKWRGLPDPGAIQEQVDEWQRIFAAFDSVAPDGGMDPLVRNVGRLQDLVNGDAEHGTKAALVGGTADVFKAYVDNLYTATTACRDLAFVAGAAMAAQQGLWQGARQDVVTILTNTADKLDEMAQRGPSADLGTTFVAAGMVLAAVGCFTAGAATVVVAGLSIGLSLVGAATSDGDKGKEVAGYSDALDFMEKLLGDKELGLGDRVKKEEGNIRSNIVGNIAAVDQNRSVFDPRPGPIESTDDINRPDLSVTATIYSLMSDIAADLSWAGNRARGSAMGVGELSFAPWMARRRCLVDRDYEVGIGRTGPTDDFQELADLLANLVLELSWEVGEAEKNLRAAVDLLDQADADAQARFAAAAAEFASGYHGDGL